MSDLLLVVLFASYLSPLFFCKYLNRQSRLILATFFIYRFIEFSFVAISFSIEWDKGNNQDALYLNILNIIIINYIISLIYICILRKGIVKKNISSICEKEIIFYEIPYLSLSLVLYYFYLLHGNFLGLFDPRQAYQSSRAGVGFLWAGYIFFISSWVLVRYNNKSNYVVTFMVYALAAYQSGSKGLLIGIIAPFIAFGYLNKKGSKPFFITAILLAIVGALNLFSAFDDPVAIFERAKSYFDMFHNSVMVYEDYLDDQFTFQYGAIYLSSIWQYVPRILYEEKPYAWGVASLVEMYFPGIASRGTPSFGQYTAEFADFGFFGFILALLNLNQIASFISVHILACNSKKNRLLTLSAIGILVVPGFNFHVPLLVAILLFSILLIEKK